MNGNKLRSLREKKGLLQKELGNDLNISASTIGMYEQGRREPDNETLKKIANYFEVSTDFLLDVDYTQRKADNELIEKEILKKTLIKANYMTKNEDLSEEELKKIIKFIEKNKDFIKNYNK